MPTGPSGEKRQTSPLACAATAARPATGEERNVVPPKRTPRLTPDQQRSEQARKAARARWNK